MFFINHLNPNEWWEWDKDNMIAYNYMGGHHSIDEDDINNADCVECKNWHELYLKKHFCPIETDKWEREAWLSPEGKFYQGEAHMVMAEYICDIIYGKESDIDSYYGEDFLIEHGWVKVASSFMWQVRLNEWNGKRLTQKQFDALYDWCECHNKVFPKGIEIK